jgi:hypothetical protein
MSIMRSAALLFALAAVVLMTSLGGCAAIHVQTDDASTEELVGRDSYAWLTAAPPAPAASTGEEIPLEPRIRRAVDEQLTAMGMERVDPDEADLLVTFGTIVDLKTKINDPFYAFYTVDRYENGTLNLEFLDGETREQLWQGSATTRLRFVARGIGSMPTEYVNTNDERDWRIPQLVESILAQYPVADFDEPEPSGQAPDDGPAANGTSSGRD